MLGAGVLSATACARIGAGYTYLAPRDLKFHNQLPLKFPDFIYCDPNFISRVQSSKKKTDLSLQIFASVLIGPGLGNWKDLERWIKDLRTDFRGSVVLDADALNILARLTEKKDMLFPKNWILTPHEGEMARLLGRTSRWVKQNREQALHLAQKKFGCCVLLKGAETLVTDGRKCFIVRSGTPALSKAGTGDVLAGVLAGFLAQGVPPLEAACAGAFVHGLAAKQWEKKKRDALGLLASDLLIEIPEVVYRIRHRGK